MHGVDKILRHIGYNLPTAIGAVNIKAICFILALLFLGAILFDWVSYSLASSIGDTSSYSGYGRKVITTAADLWDQRNIIGLGPYLRNGYVGEARLPLLYFFALLVCYYIPTEYCYCGSFTDFYIYLYTLCIQ
ncbi:UNVERIFIED_CONTAM: hypothetical protein GTU68_005741 [Idotea baltica]|nr:hypothetical protein [Idotea baltica]